MKVKSECELAQSCPTFSERMDCSLPGSSIHVIFQARVLGVQLPSSCKAELSLITRAHLDLLTRQDKYVSFFSVVDIFLR